MSERSPHDSLIKATLALQENAAAELNRILPAELVTQLDLNTARLIQESTVAADLSKRHTDCVFEVAWQTGEPALVMVLYEHQSDQEPLMAWRILEYMVRLWKAWLGNHQGATTLPAIIPVVLYHGQGRWRAPTRFDALLNLQQAGLTAVSPHLPAFEYILEDLGARLEADLLQEVEPLPPLLALTLVMFRSLKRARDPAAALRRWAPILARLLARSRAQMQITLVFNYIHAVLPEVDLQALAEAIKPALAGHTQEDLMRHVNVHAQALIEQGLEQGLEQGRQEGRQEGQAAERTELLMAMLINRFGAELAERCRPQVERVTSDNKLEVIEAIMAARTVDEVFSR